MKLSKLQILSIVLFGLAKITNIFAIGFIFLSLSVNKEDFLNLAKYFVVGSALLLILCIISLLEDNRRTKTTKLEKAEALLQDEEIKKHLQELLITNK